MCPLKLAAVLAASLSAVVIGGLLTIPPATDEVTRNGPPLTARSVLEALNKQRGPSSEDFLEPDKALSHWAESILPRSSTASSEITAGVLLERLQDEVEGVASASAGVFRTPTGGHHWVSELTNWEEPRDTSYTHLAVVTREDTQHSETYLWVVLVQRLPEFSPHLLGDGLQHFHHTCARCSHQYNGQFYGGNRILLLQCPQCEQNYDILAVSTKSRFRRANEYFSRLTPPAAFRQGMSQFEEMKMIWKSVLDHCKYRNDYDLDSLGPAKDSWQTSAETLQRRSGDCEDSSILLADWLISRGIDARVVIGETQALQGHAWCVARVDDEVYLLETTVERDEAEEEPPLAAELTDRYRPEYLFDRDRLYFFTGDRLQDPGDSWDPSLWQSVDYTVSPSPPEPTVDTTPWFDDQARGTGVHPSMLISSRAAD